MTEEDIEEMIKFGSITAFRYCILNELDFSIGLEEDEIIVAAKLYEEMWADENNKESIKNDITLKFNQKGI